MTLPDLFELCLGDVIGLNAAPVVEVVGGEAVDGVSNDANVLGLVTKLPYKVNGPGLRVKFV